MTYILTFFIFLISSLSGLTESSEPRLSRRIERTYRRHGNITCTL